MKVLFINLFFFTFVFCNFQSIASEPSLKQAIANSDLCLKGQRLSLISKYGEIKEGPFTNSAFKENCMDYLYAFLALHPDKHLDVIYEKKIRSRIDEQAAQNQLSYASDVPLLR